MFISYSRLGKSNLLSICRAGKIVYSKTSTVCGSDAISYIQRNKPSVELVNISNMCFEFSIVLNVFKETFAESKKGKQASAVSNSSLKCLLDST